MKALFALPLIVAIVLASATPAYATSSIYGHATMTSFQDYPYAGVQCCGKTNYYQYSTSIISGTVSGTGQSYTTFSYYEGGAINFTSWNVMNVSIQSHKGTLTCYEVGKGSNVTGSTYFESYQVCAAGTQGLSGYTLDVWMYDGVYWGNASF